ncbi:MAG TPA: flagellar hook basal-body protein [Bryobacteraceae bacterium]|jgi:flagellar basal body rod protein FlgG|nr:flagellar hook basal-body protein [Bryobacteraceae bacterium]
MDGISTAAASGMRARMESLEMLANNLANVETGGFKADREFFSLFTGNDATANPQTGDIPILPLIETHWTDLAQGTILNTSNPLDFAIDGDGLFAIETGGGVRYTRNGRFRVSAAGLLATADGSPVRAQGGGGIRLTPGVPIDVFPDGTVEQSGAAIGRIDVSVFDPGSLDKAGANYFVPSSGAQAKPATGTVLQGKLEQSNVGAAESAVRLVAIMRQFEMLQKAMNIGNELNRKAIEEVAKVAG